MGSDGRHAVPWPGPQQGKLCFSEPGDPTAALRLRGHTPPTHTLSSLQRCCEGISPPTPEASESGSHRAPHLHPSGRLDGDNYQAHSLCKSPPQMPPNSSWPPSPHLAGLPLPPQRASQSDSPSPLPEAQVLGCWAQKGCGKTSTRQHISSARPPGQQYVGCLTTSTSPHPSSSHHLPWPWRRRNPNSSTLTLPPTPQTPPSLAQMGLRNWERASRRNLPGKLEAWLPPPVQPVDPQSSPSVCAPSFHPSRAHPVQEGRGESEVGQSVGEDLGRRSSRFEEYCVQRGTRWARRREQGSLKLWGFWLERAHEQSVST